VQESRCPPELAIEPEAAAERAARLIQRAARALRRSGAAVGLSGGLDSAVVAALLCRALGPQKVLALIMPERDSDPALMRSAWALAGQLGLRRKVIRLTPALTLLGAYFHPPTWLLPTRGLRRRAIGHYYRRFRALLPAGESPFAALLLGAEGLRGPWLNDAVAYHRVKVRLRMVVLHYCAERENLLVAGTCNRTELAIGLFVKHGDAAADVFPLCQLYKTQVYQLGQHLELPQEILERPPTPDLLPGLDDELIIGLGYELLDRILVRLEQGLGVQAIAAELGVPVEEVRYVQRLTRRARHMRCARPGAPSWAPGRRADGAVY